MPGSAFDVDLGYQPNVTMVACGTGKLGQITFSMHIRELHLNLLPWSFQATFVPYVAATLPDLYPLFLFPFRNIPHSFTESERVLTPSQLVFLQCAEELAHVEPLSSFRLSSQAKLERNDSVTIFNSVTPHIRHIISQSLLYLTLTPELLPLQRSRELNSVAV